MSLTAQRSFEHEQQLEQQLTPSQGLRLAGKSSAGWAAEVDSAVRIIRGSAPYKLAPARNRRTD